MKILSKSGIAGLALAAVLPLSASAALLDFETYATNNEHAAADGTRYFFDGLYVEVSATSAKGDGYAYFDHGRAGLGVCAHAATTGETGPNTANRCTSGAGDDNLTFGETLTLAFWNAKVGGSMVSVLLDSIVFRDAKHKLITGSSTHDPVHSKQFTLDGNVENMIGFSTAAAKNSFTFGYAGKTDSPNQYYISSISANAVTVPEPAMLIMLLTGVIGLGIARRRTAGQS